MYIQYINISWTCRLAEYCVVVFGRVRF